MDVNSRDPSQNIIPFRIKGTEVARFDICGNLGIGTTAPSANLDVVGTVKINGDLYVNGTPLTSLTSGVVVNMDSQPVAATALNRQKKQSIPLAAASTLATSDVIAKMSGVSVGKTQVYGVGPAQMASYGNIVVAVGSGTNSIAYSLMNPPTAESWVGVPNSANTFTTQGWNITYANGTWVAVGEGTNSIAYSTTTPPVASSWVGIPTGTSINGVVNTFATRGRDIVYGNGAWVAVGGEGGANSIAYSLANPPTAESWVGIPISGVSNFSAQGFSIIFGNGTWVATGRTTNGIAYSTRTPPTADSWVVIPLSNVNDAGLSNTFGTDGINVTFANGVWLAAGAGTNTLCYSVENPPIAGSWMPITTGVLFGSVGRSLAYGNGTWVACGDSGTLLAYSTSRIPHSSSWVSMKGPTPSSSGEIINNISFNPATNTWYFLGDIGSNCMFYSTATPPVPATWIGVQRSAGAFTTQAFGAVGITTPAFTTPINVARLDNKVTFPANRMLAVGGGGAEVIARSANTPSPATTGTISYSDDDGATWAMVPGGATNAMFSSTADIAAGVSFGVGGSRGANAVAWNGEKWVAAGNGRTNSLAFSDDGGMTWSGITGKSIFSVEARDVAWNGRMWVAVGRGINFSTAYSYDGVTWMGPVTDDISGTTINVFSFDIAGPTAASSDISGGGNHVVWTGKMWVATGTRTLIAGSSPAAYYTVAYSTDGKSWTGVPESGATSTGFDIYAHGIAWNGRNFIATGRGTANTLAYFTDATVTTTPATWQGLGNTVFSVWGRGITWGARRWMATGCGTNTVAFSTNGRNWQGCGANVFKPMRRFMAMGDTGLYTTVPSGQPQRGVAFSYSDDGVTWDAPVVNQSLEFSTPLGGASDATRSVIFANNNILLTNTVTDNATAHTGLMYSTDAGASWSSVPGSSDTEANGGTGMTPANNGSYSLAMNPARTRFLVGGGDTASATRKVYFSNDGFNWRNGISSPTPSLMAWVSAALWIGDGYNRWLIGGSDAGTNTNGRIMYSGDADAVTAWAAVSPATYTGGIISCFAANTDFSVILAGATSGNVIYRSVNGGANWTTVSISGSPLGGVRSIAFSPSLARWVAVGGGGGAANTVIYSTDATATAWIAPPLQAKTAATAIFKNGSEVTRVIWDAVGGRFLVGGWNGVASTAALTNVFGLDATLNNNSGYTMAYSADGVIWTPVTVRSSDADASAFGPFLTRCREIMALDVSGDFTPINTGYTVTWNSYANRFVATGNGTTPVVYSSDGGVTWTPANQQPPQQAIAVAGGLGGTSGSTTTGSPITYTIDGKTWSQSIGAKEVFGTGGIVLTIKYGQTSTAISPNGRIWVAGGGGGSSLAFSQNGIRWTAITGASTMMTNVRAIAYAPAEQMTTSATTAASSGIGNGVWVAGGDTTNSLVFSYDGISWSEVPNSLTILSRCNACAFGGAPGVFVAGGVASTGSTAIDTTANMAYSTDGLNWQPIRGSSARIASGTSISCITYGRDETGRGLWVAGAFGSTTISILYSYNGIDWTGVSSLSSNVTGLAYGVNSRTGQGLWVASVYSQTSAGYSFLFSANGRDGWTTIPNTKTGLFEVNTSGATGISYLNGVWYATGLSAGVSTGRTLAYSYEGSSGWFGVYPTTNLYGTAVTTFSVTDMRCVATTADYANPMATAAPVRSLGWTAGVGSAYIQHPTLLFGTDSSRATATTGTANSADGGRTWGSSTVSLSRSAFRGGVCNDAFWNGAVWAAVGYDAVTGAKVATSKDGVTWTQIPAGSVPIAGVLHSIMWNGSIWMVGGDGSPTNDLNTNSIAWSPDLTAWTGIANTDTKLRIVKRISWNGMYWVAVGAGDVSTIMHSVDKNGLKWEDTYMSGVSVNKTAAAMSQANDVVWGGGRWVAVGRASSGSSSGVSILYSVDTPEVVGVGAAEYAIKGRRWTAVAGSAQLFPYGANSVCWNGKRFVATGPASGACSTGNIIAWSADGIAWTAYSSAKTVAPGQRWVAVGSGSRACIALSADGRVWTDVSGSAVLFPDISGASAALVSTMKTGARAIGWNGSSLVVGGARSATTVTATSQLTATATTGRTTIPVCAFIGSGNGVMGGGTTNVPDASFQSLTMRASSSVFITHMDVNMREASAPWANMWLNTYTDLSGTQLFQVTPETQTFSSALKWNGWSWVANFGMTTFHPLTGEQYGSVWYCTDPLARVGWSVASNSAPPRILIGQGGYAALEWNGVAWLACGYDPNNNNLIYTTDRYGATGWTAVSGLVSGGGGGGGGGGSGSASFQPVCIASSPRFWVVGGSQGTTSAIYYTSDRTGATGWSAITTAGGASVLPGIRITSVGYNGTVWICCGGGGGGTGAPASGISWRSDTGGDIGTGWAAATISGTNGGIPPIMSRSSAIAYNTGAAAPIWVVVGDVSGNVSGDQIAFTTDITGSSEWKKPTSGTLTNPTFGRLNGIAWTGYSWIATSGAGFSRLASTTDPTAATGWNNATNGIYTPTINTNVIAYANIPISLLTTGMPTTAGGGVMWRAGVGRAQGLLPGGGGETTSVIVRSANGAEGTRWSQVYSRNFLIAVGGGIIRDAQAGGGTNRMAYSYDGGLSWTTNTSTVMTSAASNAIGTIRTVKYGNGMWVAGGDAAGSSVSGNNCLAWSRDGVNWTGAGGTQIFGSAGACYAVCCNDRGRWVAVGGAALGTSGTYTNTSGAIYTMAWSDDGMNWTPILASRALFGIVCQGVSYGADASGVGMWTAIGRGGAYTGCAYSYDGKTWYLSQTSGSLFGTSVNVLTERYAPTAGVNWRSVSLSSTGQYQSAVGETGNIWTSTDYGVTWQSRATALNWLSVSLSSTGQYQSAVVYGGNIWTSTDYGVSWSERTPTGSTRSWISVSLSSTGQYQSAVVYGGNIWTSTDYGATWTSRATALNWVSVSLSSTGQYQTAVVQGGNIWTSSDYGVTWTERTTGGTKNWWSVSISSTGQYQTGVANGTNIWTSSDYGVNWTERTTGEPRGWRSVSVSSTGQYQTAVANGNNIWTSSDYGVTWSSRATALSWFSVSLSSTGQYQTAVVYGGAIFISSNFGETWSSSANDSRSLGVTYGKDASGVGMWVVTAGRRDRDVAASAANTMAYSYDGKLWRGIAASAGLSEQAWSVAYGKDGFGVGMWVAAGYDTTCGLKWSYDGVTWNATMGASGAAVWAGMAAGRRALAVYWNGSMWLASTSDTRNGEPRGTGISANNASGVPGYLLYSYNGKNWLPVLAPNTYAATISASAQPSIYSVLPNPAILDFGSFYDDQAQRGVTITNTTARTVGAVMSGGVPIENINTIVPYGRGSLTTGHVPFLLGGDSGLVDTAAGVVGIAGAGAPPPTSELASTTTSLSTSVDGGVTWRPVPNSTRVMTKVNKILCDETTQQIVAVGTGNYSVATSTPVTAGAADGWVGVFGSRMTDTRAGLFEKYGTAASWFGGAKMWIASGRAQSRRGSSLAVSVNGTVWQDAKIVSQVAAGTSLGGRGGGLTSRTTNTTTPLTFNSTLIPYTAAATPLLTYTDSAAAFSTQVGSVAANSQYNRAVVGGSGVQFVAGGRGGIAVSNDGQNWTAAAAGTTTTVFQTPTNATTRTGSGGFDASFGTVALTQRLTTPATYPSGDFRGISLSKTGQYQTAVVYGGYIWTSSDYGVTWTYRTTQWNWLSVSLSSSGQYQSATILDEGGGVYIFTSSDYGVSWTKRTQFTGSWTSISLSSTGQYQSAVNRSGGDGPYIYTSSDYGVSWTKRTQFTGGWISISVSSTGQYQSAVIQSGGDGQYIYTSSDYGVSWTKRTQFTGSWNSISVSSTGQYQSAVIQSGGDGAYIYTSSDYGVFWTKRTQFSGNWISISVSSTGQYQSAVINYGGDGYNIYTSSDYGVSWTKRTQFDGRWTSISVSSTGQYQSAVIESGSEYIYTSTDFGVTWVQRSTATRTNAFTRIKSSASGQYQLATSGPVGNTNGQLYISSDYGQSWIPRRGLASWLGGAVSATGAVMTAFLTPSAATAVILRSTDYGNTFTDISGTTLTGSAYWRAIAMTNSAAIQTALAHGGAIYRSSDTGSTWNSTAVVDVVGILTTEFSSVASPTYAWKSIAMSSADAKIQTGVVSGGQIYVNSNYGREAWAAVDSARNWTAVAMSADGRYQSAVVTSGAIYYNSTSGTGTWTAVSSPTGLTWTGIAVSSADGKYQTAVASGATNIYVNANFGAGTWTAKEGARNWFGVAMSATGRYQTAINRGGFIYIDASFGEAASWTSVDSQRDWASVAMSSTGQYQTAVVAGGKIYANNNYGAHGAWTETESNRAWFSVAVSSATGRYQTAVVQNGQIYTNANFGAGAWFAVDSSRNWVSVTVSADGKYQSAAVATSGQVYFSRDYGATWSTTAGLDIMGNRWQDVAVAAETGAVQVTCVSGGYLYVSSDTGANWVSTTVNIDGAGTQTTNRVWQAVAVSANGQYGLACVNSTSAQGFLYRSTDSGASWVSSAVIIDGVGTQVTNRPWQDVGMSANGKYQVACINSNNQQSFTSTFASAVSVMVTPPGALTTTFGTSWTQRGADIDGEAVGDQSGYSVSLSADGTVVAVGAPMNFGANGRESGQVRVYALNGSNAWIQRGADIDGAAGLSSLPMVVTATGTSVSGNWYSVAMSATGQYQTASTYGGTDGIIISSNYGVSWSSVPSGNGAPTNAQWLGISISSTGQYQTASIVGGNIYTSSNYGVNWTARGSVRNWEGVSISSNGQYQTAAVDGGSDGGIYRSSDFGVNWTQVPSGNGSLTGSSAGFFGIAISSNGQYQSATLNGGGIYLSSNFGVNWVLSSGNGAPTNQPWREISMSSSGEYQTALATGNYVYVSSNFGMTWTAKSSTAGLPLRGVSISSTGQYQSAAVQGGQIQVSSDFGMTWVAKAGSLQWGDIAVSSTGQYQTAAVVGTLIYFSRDYGFTWSSTASYEITEGDRFGTSVSLSANGNTVAVGSPYADSAGIINRGRVRVHNWSGSAWSVLGTDILLGEGSNDYSGMSVSLSEDGKVVAVGAPLNDGAGNLTDSGHARVYAWDGSAWAQRGADIDGVYGLTATNRVVTATGTSGGGNWYSVAMSATGQYQTAVVNGSNIRTSSNYGVTWSERTTGATRSWRSVSLSSNGQYQTSVAYNGNIWTSSDYGVTWNERTAGSSREWSSVSLSSNGQYQTAVVDGGNIWTSSNYGVTWDERTTGATRSWYYISLSSTGQYQTAVVSGGNIWTSSDYGVSWSERTTGSTRAWSSVSLSSTGQYQSAVVDGGNIWTSSNYGVNWSERITGSTRVWSSVSLSSTGQYQSAVVYDGNIWTSSDYGVSWTSFALSGGWFSVSISSTGQYQTALIVNGIIYFSRDYGFTWSSTASYEITEGDQAGTSVSLSADGSVVAVGSPYADTTSGIDSGQMRVFAWSGSAWSLRGTPIIGESVGDRSGWSASMSADGTTVAIGAPYNNGANGIGSGQVRVYKWSGSAWGAVGTVDIDGEAGVLTPPRVVTATGTSGIKNWWRVSLSSTGQYQSALVNNGNIWTSSDYGASWSERTTGTTRAWYSVSLSSTGQYQSAVVETGNIWTSSDYGVTWQSRATALNWVSVSLSSTGQYQTAVIWGGNIWTSSDYGVSWSERTPTGSTRSWFSVSLSSTGQYQTAIVASGNIWSSSDYGATWTSRATSLSWYSVSLSSTGQYQTAVVNNGQIHTSSDFGINWTPRHGGWIGGWYSVSLSSTGQYQTAVNFNGNIHISSDYGVNWTPRYIIAGWISVSVSSTGQYQTAVVENALIYFSRDYGFTWSSTASYEVVTGGDQSGYSLSLSADGNSLAVGAPYNDAGATGADRGHVRVYDYNPLTNIWSQRGVDNDGEASDDLAGWSVSLSADGTTVAFGAPMNDGSGNLLPNTGSVRVFTVPVTNPITYTSSSSSIADICGNLLLIKGAAGTTNIVATQGATTTNGVLTVSGTTYTLVYTTGTLSLISFIFYSKNYGASWTSLTAAGSRAWSSVALSENGGTISATTSDAAGGVWVYAMPDDQYYRAAVVANSGSTTTPATVRAITYGNSGTGAATDGYWVAGADASGNSLAYSSNGMDWTAVAGSKTGLFNAVNGVAYGADGAGTPLWVAVGLPFVGSVPGTTAFSIAYSYNMTTWVGVRNAANFTGQGNHVAYGQDEYGAGVWVAVGQGDGVLSANLGDSALYSSNGTAGTSVFYSYDGANWAAGTGLGVFAVSGTDVAWGVDVSGVGIWVATGIGFTDPTTGAVIAGGQVAHSTNGRVWTPIRAPSPIVPATTPTTISTRESVIPPPPASTGFTASYITAWGQVGLDILGTQASEISGISVSLSADGTIVAIGSSYYDVTGTNEGRVRVYKYNGTAWGQLGLDILGTQASEISGESVSLSADGMTVAIGSYAYDVTGTNNEGRTRVYKYNGTSWGQLGLDISGNQAYEQSGESVTLSADGTTVAIVSLYYDVTGANAEGRTRVYKYNGTSWGQLGLDISGNQANEQSGNSVSLSADGTTVAIGSRYYDVTGTNEGRTRVYKYNGTSWGQLGLDISGNLVDEQSGESVSLSADGTTVAIGSPYYDITGTNDVGRTRVYKYNGTSWGQLGLDISGNQASEYSGIRVSLSADGMTVAIGSPYYDVTGTNNEGRVRVYKYNGTSWSQLGLHISGNQASEVSGYSVSLSADGTTVAIGSYGYDVTGTNEGRTRVYKLVIPGATFSSSNPAIAEISGGILLIKDGASGTTTITATQPAIPPFTLTPVIVQGTLTVSGSVYTLLYNNVITTFTPFTTSALTVAYGRAGSQGAGAPLWIVGGAGGTNVFAMSSAPTTIGAWSVVASNAPTANAPFPVCNSIGYSNGVWVAGNNTDATNILARSTNGGSTWTPVAASSVSSILTGAAALGANAFCNYSLAVADYSNDTNIRSWVAVQGTKNFFFEGGVSAVATVTPDVSASVYNAGGTRAWWVAGGVGLAGVASIGSTSDPSGATGWTKSASAAIANLAGINAIAFSPHTQRWLAVGAGAAGSLGTNILYSSDASGTNWAAGAVTSALTPVITLNTCVWNQPPASASSAGRWLAGGTRNGGVGADAACVYISTDVSGAATPWTPVTGTGTILSQVYSLAYNGSVWIAAGTPATDNGSTSTLMRTTTDPTGATGWQGIPATNASTGGFDTAARSVTWNAEQQMWIATGENTSSTADASFSSVIYSLDINGAAGTWRTVRESNSLCFSGEGTGIAFTGDKWFASGEGNRQIVATTGPAANAVGATAASWTPVAHGTALTRASDIAYTGRRLVASGAGTGATNGVIISTDNTGSSWTSPPATPGPGFTDASGGGTSVTFEASYEGTGRLIATGRSATNALSVSADGGTTWATPSVQFSSVNTVDATTQPLFTTGGNSVAYVGNDTLFAAGGNDVHWTGKRWVAVGRNSAATATATATPATVAPPASVEIVNNNTAPVATSVDGITWQCVRASQAPNLSEGSFIAANARIGATPLINSQITIADGGDTEEPASATDYVGGIGTGIAQIDIIAELTPVSHAAFSGSSGTVGIIGAAGNGGANGVGNASTPSFDNTAFTITTRPM